MTFISIILLIFAIWNGFYLRIGAKENNSYFLWEVNGLSEFFKDRNII